MTNQEKHFEENKEHSKISEDYPNSVSVQNPPKENSLHSILLSVTFYLSIIYLVLFFFYFAPWGDGWGFVVLIFLGPNLLSLAIGASLIRLGMKKGNKAFSMRVLDSICCLSSWLLIRTGKYFELLPYV